MGLTKLDCKADEPSHKLDNTVGLFDSLLDSQGIHDRGPERLSKCLLARESDRLAVVRGSRHARTAEENSMEGVDVLPVRRDRVLRRAEQGANLVYFEVVHRRGLLDGLLAGRHRC